MNNQPEILMQFPYINHQLNTALDKKQILEDLNPTVTNVRSTPQFSLDLSNVNPYQSNAYTAIISCQVGTETLTKTFQINVKDYDYINTRNNNQTNNQTNNQPNYQQAPQNNYRQPENPPKKKSIFKRILLILLVFILIVLGFSACSIYNQNKETQSQNAAQNQQIRTELDALKTAQKTYQEDHDKQELNNSLSQIQNQINQLEQNEATNALNSQINQIKNNPNADVDSKINDLKGQMSDYSSQTQSVLDSINTTLDKIKSKIGIN
ncbi:hypothetical protein R4B61_02350 [Fructilactobacillus vespulae]|uniref:hypothetical protein n=1 Tax=Fructilactobacillus vespulae TaxID=1249630 RepID=UPI0039B5F8F1